MTIEGDNFPVRITLDIQVEISEIPCIINSISNTQITCTTGEKKGADFSNKTLKIIANSIIYEKSDSFTYIQVLNNPSLESIIPDYISPGDKKTLSFMFNDLSTIDISKISITLRHKIFLDYSIKINPLKIDGNKLTARFGGAKSGEYNVDINITDYGLSKLVDNLSLKVGFEINSILPTDGSIEGGTEVLITGKNFLLTQVNQNIFLGKTRCLYKTGYTHTDTVIKCITQKPTVSTNLDELIPVVIEQMIQYSSICKGNTESEKCEFKYDSTKTCKITRLDSAQSNNNLIFGLNDEIIIFGENFLISDNINTLSFTWGEITIDSKTVTSIKGKISKINDDNYGINKFLMYHDHGLCTQAPETPYEIYNDVMIFLRKPEIEITDIKPLISGQYGTILKIYTPITDFFSQKINNSIRVCDEYCSVLKKNIIFDDPLLNHVQCVIKKKMAFAECNKIILTYFNIEKEIDIFKIESTIENNYCKHI